MKNESGNQTVFWELLQLMYQGKHRLHQIAEEYGLTVMQASALIMLSKDEPKPMHVLSDYFTCDASTVTGLVDRMEKHGIISRQNHPKDRRITLIALTPEGARLKEEITAKTEQAEASRLGQVLSTAERQTLHDLLQRLLASSAD
jgi:DNA-binding MarR family transcriptional regulator